MDDAISLERFVEAQADTFETALGEIRRGAKRSHWMWFIFPQLAALGRSPTAKHYGIADAAEALAYLDHTLLGPRYMTCVQALQDLQGSNPVPVFGPVDALKLRSSLTLFEAVRPSPLLAAALGRLFGGRGDELTLNWLKRA